ncbi:DUF4384 domain-containing protein [Deinococcus aerophilus]|uniref:S-layer protein n=1 Tax=Deinococcus aerophilus TaxID=522488 RepID=A0ABQ2GV58_9DEIO|nr:DUF4384 domain-containing protein [Deinococcus aerophilus]GGM13102.1 S-layer protein [Deinococcus aerophilus]
MKVFLFLSSVLGLGSMGLAAPQISAQSIIVNPVPGDLKVRVWTDRDVSGQKIPAYTPGDRIRLYASVSQDAYVYLFNVDPSGQVDLILPNRYQGGANFVKANAVKVFPAAGDPFTFDIAAPYGVNKVLALASKTPLKLDQIATFKAQNNSFADVQVKGQQGLAQALSIVVTPVAQNTWHSATAYYQVTPHVSAAPAPVAAPPRNAAPLTGAPAATQGPWGVSREWKTTLDTRSTDLRGLHERYAAFLKAEGYQQVELKSKKNEISSEYRRGSSDRAELSVKRKGHRTEIRVERR